jgi:hypothetical protein
MRRARADLLIWGRAHRTVDRATIYFLMPHDCSYLTPDTEAAEQSTIAGQLQKKKGLPGSRIYEFDKSSQEFGAHAAETIAIAALMCVLPIFAAQSVQKLKSKYALALCHKLEPFISGLVAVIPENLRAEIRGAYVSASQGLGRQLRAARRCRLTLSGLCRAGMVVL